MGRWRTIKMKLKFNQIKVLPPLALAGGGLILICLSVIWGNTDTYNDSIKNELDSCGLPYVVNGLLDAGNVSIEQWLNNIRCCEMVITDSCHVVVFSIIFGKKFKFMGNERRGNDRVESLMKVVNNIKVMKDSSLNYLFHINK